MARLPTVTIGRTTYFIDYRLNQIRNVNNPHKYKELTPQLEKTIQRAINRQRYRDALDNVIEYALRCLKNYAGDYTEEYEEGERTLYNDIATLRGDK